MEELLESMQKRFPKQWEISLKDTDRIYIRDGAIEKGRAFSAEIVPHISFYTVTIAFESFASDLMIYAEAQIQNSESRVRQVLKQNSDVVCRMYRQFVEVDFNPDTTREDGWRLEIQFPKFASFSMQEKFIGLLFSVILLLFPYGVEAQEEGKETATSVDQYERSEINRAICLSYYGYRCAACDENLKDKYGEVANEFIHVHHLNPISEAGVVVPDPIKDLVPLCPNCHAIAHLRTPPYTIEELRTMLKKTS